MGQFFLVGPMCSIPKVCELHALCMFTDDDSECGAPHTAPKDKGLTGPARFADDAAKRSAVGEMLAGAIEQHVKEPLKPDPANPKDAIGAGKLPLHLWPVGATALGCLALLDGAYKYGRNNFRVTPVRASIYIDAAMRHILKYLNGEECDPVSKVPHIGHALASLAIIVDAQACASLIDDRNLSNPGVLAMLDEVTKLVDVVRQNHINTPTPVHYTIKDSAPF